MEYTSENQFKPSSLHAGTVTAAVKIDVENQKLVLI